MKIPRYFSVLAALTSLFVLHAGAQGTPVHPQPAPAGASTVHQPTPEQIAKMPVRALHIQNFKLLTSGTGWASTGSRLLRTTDNGAHWKDISPPVPALADPNNEKLSGVFFLDAQTGWLLYVTDTDDMAADGHPFEYDTHLASTVDGGATWTTVSQLPRLDPWQEVTGGGFLVFSDKLHGWADLGVFHGGVLFATSDGGRTWQRPKGDPEAGVEIVALTDKDVWFAGGPDNLLYVTHDGADKVEEVSLPNPPGIPQDYFPIYGLPIFKDDLNGYEVVNYRGPLGSKSAAALFMTGDGGHTWKPDRIVSGLVEGETVNSAVVGSAWILPFSPQGSQPTLVRLRSNDKIKAPDHKSSGDFRHCDPSFLTPSEGWMNCSGELSSTNDGGTTWTAIAPRVRNGALTTDQITPVPAPKPMKTHPIKLADPKTVPTAANTPSGGTQSGIDQHLGFDSTDVLPEAAMKTWWDSSPFYDVGVYLPGSPNKSTKHAYPTAAWVDAVIGQGWGIWPIWFGLQSECIVSRKGVSKYISSDPKLVECQGKNQTEATCQGTEQADKAYKQVTKLGLDGSIIYFDIEPYATNSTQCSKAVRAYVGAFVNEMHENAKGGSVGVYASYDNAPSDIYNASTRPDDIWIANNSKRVTVWNLGQGASKMLNAKMTDDLWPSYQRMHQYRVDAIPTPRVFETWGGAGPYNIDEDLVDATVVQSTGTKEYPTTGYTPFSPGSNESWLMGIANGKDNSSGLELGEAVGSYALSDTPSYPEYYPGNYPTAGFTYLGGATTAPISFSGAYETVPSGINNLGQVVGSYYVVYDVYGDATTQGFYTTASKPTTPIPLADYPGSGWTQLIGINDAGWIVGNYIDVDDSGDETGHCALWKPPYTDPPKSFDMPGAQPLSLNGCSGINGLGQIIGQAANSEGTFTPFVDDAEAGDPNNQANFSTVSAPDYAWYVSVVGINNNGQIAGSYYDVTSLLGAGFLLNGSEFIPFPNPVNSEDNFSLYGINDDVQMVAGDVILNGLPIQP